MAASVKLTKTPGGNYNIEITGVDGSNELQPKPFLTGGYSVRQGKIKIVPPDQGYDPIMTEWYPPEEWTVDGVTGFATDVEVAEAIKAFGLGSYAAESGLATSAGQTLQATAANQALQATAAKQDILKTAVDLLLKTTEFNSGSGKVQTVTPHSYLPATDWSPANGNVVFLSSSTLTCTGFRFTVDASVAIRSVGVTNAAGEMTVYENGIDGISLTAAADVITIKRNGVAYPVFVNTDTSYKVAICYEQKAHDQTRDTQKVDIQNWLEPIEDSLLDTTNIAAATNYYPSALGMALESYKFPSLTGKFIDADGTMTMAIEVTNDEDTTNADWIDASLSCKDVKTGINVIAAALTVTNGTLTFGLNLENLNFSYFRVKMVNDGATNTGIIKLTRKA